MVTAVAVVNFVLGGLNALCGGLLLLGGGVAAGAGATGAVGGEPEAAAAATIVGGVLIVLGILVLLLSLPTIIAGVGIVKRRQWGRILTLILGGISGVLGLLSLIALQPGGLLQLAYAIFVFVVLLNEKYAAEFA
jgi:hypothetical protein